MAIKGLTLIQKLQKLFGARNVSDMMGKTTNVQTLAQGTNNPFARTFSKKYLEKNPDGVDEAAQVILENMQFAFGNKNLKQMTNFENNVDTLYNLKFPPKAGEAKVVDIGTKKQVTGEGLMSLKEDLGLPPEVNPKSPMGQNLQEIKKTSKQMDLKGKEIQDDIEGMFGKLGKAPASKDVMREGQRRPIIRQILAEDEGFRKKLSTEEYDELLFGKDLDKGGDPNKDPLVYLNKYFERDLKQLDTLDNIIDEMPFSTPAEISAEFRKRTGGLKAKKTKTVEDFTDEGDFDPGGMAQGGRAGYSKGKIVTEGIPALIKKIKDRFGKKAITTADKLDKPKSALNREMFEEFNERVNKKPEALKGDELLTKQEVSFENKIKNQLETTYDDISGGSGFTGSDYKYDAQVLADGIAEDLGFVFADLPINQQTQLYNAALSRTSKDLQMKRLLRKALKPKDRKLNAQGGLAGQLHMNEGGRVGLEKGGPPNPGRRNFMKLMAGLASLPFVGKLFKPIAKTVGEFKGTPNLIVDITKTPNMPDWYIPLIKKVLKKGDDVTSEAASVERQTVHRDILPDGDEVMVTQDVGNQTIDVSVANPKANYLSASGAGDSPYTIQYSKGKVIEEGKYKGQKEPDKLEVEEPYVVHNYEDAELDFDMVNYNPKKEVHDTSVLESYATGKKIKNRGTKEVPDPYEGYSPDLKADDYAKGGLAGQLKL